MFKQTPELQEIDIYLHESVSDLAHQIWFNAGNFDRKYKLIATRWQRILVRLLQASIQRMFDKGKRNIPPGYKRAI